MKMTEGKQYVINNNNIQDFLTISQFSKGDFRKFSHKIMADMHNPDNEKISISEYKWSVSYLCHAIGSAITQCANALQNIQFSNFSLKQIYISKERKEILAVSNIVNDSVMEEYYDTVYDTVKPICPECVFMIAEDKDIDYSVMPKFDLKIEVEYE